MFDAESFDGGEDVVSGFGIAEGFGLGIVLFGEAADCCVEGIEVAVNAAADGASGSATPPLAWYRFTPDRTGAHPQKELASFKGHLQADAYAGYDKLYQSGRVTEVACWAHFRRKIFDIHKPRPTTLTTDILERIAALYAIEAEVRGQLAGVRQKVRQERSRPLIAELRKILDDAHRRLSPKSVMALAIAYGTKRWTALTQFLDNGSLEIDNSAH
jgi:transposase